MGLPVQTFPPDFKFSTLDQAVAVTPDPSNSNTETNTVTYNAFLPADWCIGVVPHGGFLTTLLLSATSHYFTHTLPSYSQPHPVHIALTFATRCTIGPATIVVAPLKLGRQYSFVRVLLQQHGHTCIDATVTHADMGREVGATLPTRGIGAVPDREKDCVEPLAGGDPLAGLRAAMQKLRLFVPSDSVGGSHRPGLGRSVREQWVALKDGSGRGLGALDLGFLCDMFMPLGENYEETRGRSWYPTLALAVEIKSLPPPDGWKWLFCRVESGNIRGGRMDIDVVVCDEEHCVVAISRQVAIVVSSARNSKKTGKGVKL